MGRKKAIGIRGKKKTSKNFIFHKVMRSSWKQYSCIQAKCIELVAEYNVSHKSVTLLSITKHVFTFEARLKTT